MSDIITLSSLNTPIKIGNVTVDVIYEKTGQWRVLRWIFCCLTMLCCLSCENKVETGDASYAPIRFAISAAPVTLDARFTTDAVASRINRLVYQRMVEFDSQNLPIPSLTSWQAMNSRHYRFKLIHSVAFHHGKPLTVHDIKATYEYILDASHASPHRSSLQHIKKIAVVDNNTLDFYLSRDDPLLPAFLVVDILPKDLMEKNHPFNKHPIGSGPFKFVEWPFREQLRLSRLRDQQLVEFVTVKDPNVRVLKLLSGEADLMQNNLPPEHIRYLKKQPGITFQTKPGNNYSYLGFNLEDPKLKSLQVRKAIALALHRDKIIKYALGGAANKATGFFTGTHWAGLDLPPYRYDVPAAKQLMQAAGYSQHNPLQLSYKTTHDPFRVRIATIIQSQLREIYIHINIRSFDWGTFYGDIKQGNFQLYSLTWVGIKTPDIFKFVFHSQSLPPQGANRGRFKDQKTDDLIKLAEQSMALDQQARYYQILQQRLQQQLPYVSLWYEDNIGFYHSSIKGYQVSNDGSYDGLLHVKRVIQH